MSFNLSLDNLELGQVDMFNGSLQDGGFVKRPLDVLMLVMQIVCAVVIVIGSIALVLIIILKQELRSNPRNWIVLSGLVGLLIHGLVVHTIFIKHTYSNNISQSECWTVSLFVNIPIVPFTLVAIALYQVLVKCHPGNKYQNVWALVFIIYSWVVSACIQVVTVTVIGRPMVTETEFGQICHSVRTFWLGESVMFFIVSIPTTIIMFILTCILCPCCCPNKHQDLDDEMEHPRHVAILVWVSFVVFIILHMPYEMILVAIDFDPSHAEWSAIMVLYYSQMVFKPVLPFMWMVLLPDVRAVLCACCCKSGNKNPEFLHLVSKE